LPEIYSISEMETSVICWLNNFSWKNLSGCANQIFIIPKIQIPG
jgi:hypothetical protein